MASFANNLKSLRSSKNMTQQQLADSMGISKSALNMYERGERQPNFETLELIADYFNVSIDFLLGKRSDIQCPICYNTYNPLNKYDVDEHAAFHSKFLKASEKFGEIILYSDAEKRRGNAIIKFRNRNLSIEERLKSLDEYLKYAFMISIWQSGFNLKHLDFEDFINEELLKIHPDHCITRELCNAIGDKYGIYPTEEPLTIAAHKDGDNFTPEELEKIEEYKKLLIAARPKE